MNPLNLFLCKLSTWRELLKFPKHGGISFQVVVGQIKDYKGALNCTTREREVSGQVVLRRMWTMAEKEVTLETCLSECRNRTFVSMEERERGLFHTCELIFTQM